MTKREHLSFALRRLRTLKTQEDTALRIQVAHDIIKEIINEALKSTKNADLGPHINQLLDELYAQNTGVLEDGHLPAPLLMPDLTEPIDAQTQAMQAMTSDEAQVHRTEVAALLRQTLSLFALGPNEVPMATFLHAFEDQMKRANALPPPIPDCSEQIQGLIDELSNLDGLEDPDHLRKSAVSCLRHALSVFAQGPNQTLIETFLDRFTDRMDEAHRLPAPVPDYTEQIQVQINALSNLSDIDSPLQMVESAIGPLCQALSVFAQGPNEQPIQTVLDKVHRAIEQVNTLPPPAPDYAPILQPHLDQLEALANETDPEVLSQTGATLLSRILSTFAHGPNEEPIQRVLDAVERIEKQKELTRLSSPGADSLQPHIDALMELEDLDDPDALTAAAAMTLYEVLAEMAQGPNAASIQALLDTFDKVTGAD